METWKLIKNAVKVVYTTLQHRREAKYLYEASRLLKEAIDEADEEHAKDGWRYHVIWDEARGQLISITYEIHRGRWNSYQYLRQRGRFKEYMPPKQLKELSFYYTASRWVKGCPEEERLEKMKEFQQFYVKKMMRRWRLSSFAQGSKKKAKESRKD